MSIPDDLRRAAEAWRDDDLDEPSRAELDTLLRAGDARELADRFGSKLEFGTAGLRGVLGAGPARMNRAVVVRTTAGLAAYLLRVVPDVATRGVVIGRDGRRLSPEFTADTAAVLAAAGIPAHVFDGVVPTPLVSFAVRALGAAAGVMITASHNPPEYNGYKVYWSNAAQIVPPHDERIADAIDAVGPARAVPSLDRAAAEKSSLFRVVGDDVERRYYDAIVACSRRSEGRADLRVVYTPMHGVGDRFVHAVFARFGFGRVVSVPEQAAPDGAFPTVRFPNPEEPGALDLALALARKEDAHVVLANDPDADRLAVAVPDPDRQGSFVALTGNEIGVLLAHYLLVDDPKPAKDRLVLTTIVSSPLLSVIARELGVRYEETLTGFKWIANRAMALEAETGTEFVMGYEEALGYTVGTVARDKDGVGAAAIFAELVASLRARGETVLGRLEAIHRRFGLVVSKQHNVTRKGADGAAQIKREMAAVRARPPTTIGDEKVLAVRDSLGQLRSPLDGGTATALTLPRSDVLAFELAGGTRITMRPSGTEPKIKYYFDVREPIAPGEPFAEGRARAVRKLEALEKAFVELASKAAAAAS
ncbi:MAG: phospho-sugar mutase [Polyangiales bacterium]